MTIRIHPDKAARRPHVPEEGRAFDRAIALLNGTNPLDRVIVTSRGETACWGLPPENARGAMYDVVYIRDDGWTLGAPAKWRSVAEGMDKGGWIGHLELSISKKLATLFVITQQGLEYKAGELDMNGNVITATDAPEPPPLESNNGQPSGGRTLEQMRSWMAAGCPEEE